MLVGLPGPFDVDLLAELTSEVHLVGPMRTTTNIRDEQFFNKLGAYKVQFWLNAAMFNN